MQRQRMERGLTQDEHQRASGLLQRAATLVNEVSALMRGRYHPRGPILRDIANAARNLRAVRTSLETAGRAEHPLADVVYLAGDAPRTPDTLADALAGQGEGVGDE